MTLHLSLHLMSLIGRVPVDATVWTLRVVEQDSSLYCFCYLTQNSKRLPVQQLILYGTVDTLGHRIVLRVATLSHAGSDMAACEYLDIVGTGILAATVGVVYQRLIKTLRQRAYGHPQCLETIDSLQRGGYIPAHNALAVGIHDNCQEAEAVAQTGRRVLDRNIRDIADPYLIGAHRYHVLHEVGVCRQAMP